MTDKSLFKPPVEREGLIIYDQQGHLCDCENAEIADNILVAIRLWVLLEDQVIKRAAKRGGTQ